MKYKYRKIRKALFLIAALVGKILTAACLMTAGVFFAVHAFSPESYDDLRMGALLIKYMAVSFIVMSLGMTLVAVREAIEDSSRGMMMKTNVTIELSFDSDTVTAVDVVNRIKDLIESDSLSLKFVKEGQKWGNR